jgi:thiamine pyrophosphokinase
VGEAGTATTVIVFTGGDPVAAGALDDLPADAFVIAADSGIEHALAHGRHVDLAVGDFDSVSPDALARITEAGAILEQHPADKDKTDFELALDAAVVHRPRHLVVVGGHGGRIDHFLGNVTVLLSDAYAMAGTAIEARMDTATVHVVRGRLDLQGAAGDVVTLLAPTGPVDGVTTAGLRYPLAYESLVPGSSRGVSNELVGTAASIEVERGTLLVLHVRS